ncbi:MAG: D-2-hydroxyacid dehydrogenase [Bacillota bacterium]|nr:D-2-hydroxyacid dehydrogenase [Bacillota bacterium]
MDIVILDGHTINPGDLSWSKIENMADNFTVYGNTPQDQVMSRIGDSECVMLSKCIVTREMLEQMPNLKYIGVTATGYNNVDVKAAHDLGVAVTNVPSYATDAVAQHTIALMLEITNNVSLHNRSVQAGEWTNSEYFCYWKTPIMLLAGKSLGIVGYGEIGRKVADIAKAMGMTINIYSRNPEETMKSDFISLHCPLTTENAKMINEDFISRMKPGAILINTARGGLIDEEALAKALKNGTLAAAATDVLSKEPPAEDCPLLGLDNCIITPHLAWAPVEMRQIVIDTLASNLASWLEGGQNNRVDG